MGRVLLLLWVFITASCGAPQDPASTLEGYPGAVTRYVEEPFSLYANPPTRAQIASFILKTNSKYDSQSADRMAGQIKIVAQCFQVDERLLASQIRQESRFDENAESPTHAIGLMQLTGIGIQEIEDQLGRRGNTYAGALAIAYYNALRQHCLQDSFGTKFSEDLRLWYRTNTGSATGDLLQKKSFIRSEPLVGMVYGAVMLKALLSKAKTEKPSGDYETYYRRALWLYNGDPKEQDHYQAVILQRALEI